MALLATVKRCRVCRHEKPLSEFYRNAASPDGLLARCKGCHRDAVRRGAGKRPTPKSKRCPSCERLRRASCFYADSNRPNGLSVYCKDCQNDGRSQRRQRDRGWRKAQRKSLYGLTEEAHAALVASQGGLCAVCRQPPKDSRTPDDPCLQVDHDHRTKRVRGLLCGACNRAIGLMRDDPRRLLQAAKYLLGR